MHRRLHTRNILMLKEFYTKRLLHRYSVNNRVPRRREIQQRQTVLRYFFDKYIDFTLNLFSEHVMQSRHQNRYPLLDTGIFRLRPYSFETAVLAQSPELSNVRSGQYLDV